VRYVKPPDHVPLPDHWEWARQQATGELCLMLADDDALCPIALERFADLHDKTGAEFIGSPFAEYRDPAYPGALRNTLECARFPGVDLLIDQEQFVRTLLQFRPAYNMHPTAFVFSTALANRIAARAGRYFKTIGVEYYAWPVSVVLAHRPAYIGVPIALTGRTAKSWGTNMVQINPGKEKINQFMSDVSRAPRRVPLENFLFVNLMAEGMLAAKEDFPDALGPFEFDERQYARETRAELLDRKSHGVDVTAEWTELEPYWSSLSGLEPIAEPAAARRVPTLDEIKRDARRTLERARDRVIGAEAWRGFSVRGDDYGFSDIVQCGDFLARIAASPGTLLRRQAESRLSGLKGASR
jgi:hypothetical protein